MTSISPEEQTDSALSRLQATLTQWAKPQVLIGGAIVIAVAAFIAWFIVRQKEINAQRAEAALSNAKQSLVSGNMALAQSDLQTAFNKYSSTSAGVEAAMLLAQTDYDAGKAQDGIAVLQKASGSSAAGEVAATIRGLEGDGYAQMGKLADAAKQYQAAADAARGDTEKTLYLARAARTYQAAGDTASARKLWSDLATNPKTQGISGEAKVRLGELDASAVKR